MARPKSDTPSYCHHKRSGRAYVTIDGQQRTLPGPHGSDESRAAYDRLVSEWLSNGRTLSGTTPNGPTVSMIAIAFWKHAEAYYRKADGTPTSEVENLRQILRVLRKREGDTPARDFGPKRLKALRDYVVADRQEKDEKSGEIITTPGWCRTYTNRQIKRVQLLFRWAASEELLPVTVAQALATVPGIRQGAPGVNESQPVEAVDDELVNETLPHLPPPVAALVQLQRLTGARGGELLTLRTCDLDMTGGVWKHRPAEHKTAHKGKARTIRFGPQAQAILSPFLRSDVQTYLFDPAASVAWFLQRQRDKRDTPPTPSQIRRAENASGRRTLPRYDRTTYARAIARACLVAFPLPADLERLTVPTFKSNGRKHKRWETATEWRKRLGERWPEVQAWRDEHHWHPHQLRHAAATAFRRDADFESAKTILGHSSDSMTSHYAERDELKADAVVARIG